MKLKAAVKQYQPLHAEGKTEAEVKETISNDENSFDQEAVDQIYQAIIESESDDDEQDKNPQQHSHGKYFVIAPFRDIQKFQKLYKVGDDVSHFDEDRLDRLVKNNLVELK